MSVDDFYYEIEELKSRLDFLEDSVMYNSVSPEEFEELKTTIYSLKKRIKSLEERISRLESLLLKVSAHA